VTVIMANGDDAGTYTGGSPTCATGAAGLDTWSVQCGDFLAGPGTLSTLQITDEPDESIDPPARIFSAYIVIGPVMGGRGYILSIDRFSETPYVYDLDDDGTTAVFHVSGVSLDNPLGPGGVDIELTVNCATVDRR
jgi:hypothetical protein